MNRTFAALFLFAAAPLWAQDRPVTAPPPAHAAADPASVPTLPPRVTGDTAVQAYQLVKLRVTNPYPRTAYSFDVQPRNISVADINRKGEFQFTGAPGTYEIKVQSYTSPSTPESDPVILQTFLRATIAPSGPVPPGPGPGPTPPGPTPPAPVTDKLVIAVIEETGSRTPEQARVLFDPLWASLTQRGHKWAIFDVNDPIAIQKKYVEAAGNTPLPAVVVMNGAGTPIDKFTLLLDPAALDAKFKTYTGGK